MKETILTLLFIASMALNVYQYVNYLPSKVIKYKIEQFQDRIDNTNSMAVESAYKDSIMNAVNWYIKY